MNERTLQQEIVMRFLCLREDEGGLGYRETASNVVHNNLFIPSHLAEFVSKSEPDVWRRLLSLYKGDEKQLITELEAEVMARYTESQNAATFFNKNRTLNFGGECVPLYYASGSEMRGDADFEQNIFAAVQESPHVVEFNGQQLSNIRPDVSFFLNGIFIGYMELKSVAMGQNAAIDGRGKVVKDYLTAIKAFAQLSDKGENELKSKRAVLAQFEKAIHLTACDINDTYVIRNIAGLYEFASTKLAGATPASIDAIAPEFIKVFKPYPVSSGVLTETQRFEQVMTALYSKRMVEKEILYYNFMEYKMERTNKGVTKFSHHGRLISPRPKQKFGCDKIMGRIKEMLDNEKDPNFYTNKLRRELQALDIPQSKVEEIILKREQYCNNKYVYSLLMQYAAGFGKSNIIGWTALQLKDFRYEGAHAYDKIMLVVDRLQLRGQLDSTMRNMNIDKSMFIEATDKATFIEALESPKRIIVVNIQKFLDLQKAIDDSGTKLKNMRVAFLIDEIHRSNSGENNQQMIDLFERLQESFKGDDGQEVVKKNLLIGFTATPSEETLSRFGEFKSASIVPLWVPFDAYTMKEAIEDGYILDPTKHIFPYSVPVTFGAPDMPDSSDDPVKIRQSKEKVYAYEPRMRKIAEFIVDRLVSLVYSKIRGEGKAMLAVTSIPNAIKYTHIIRELYKEKCAQKPYDKYADAPISIVYSDNQKSESSASLNYGKNEAQVIQEFKSAKNGLIIVVDKLQTGFDEPKLHTLFLDKEISDINAIQTISRVNRTCKYKQECHVIDCSWKNANVGNIKAAFRKFCDMGISEFNPEEQKRFIAESYKAMCAFDLYKNWFDRFKESSTDTSFMLQMEDAFRRWIQQCIDREIAIKKQNIENGYSEGEAAYITPTNEARDLRLLISRYAAAIESVKNVFDIDPKYTDEAFYEFWRVYCSVYRDVNKNPVEDGAIVVEPTDVDEPGFTMVDDEGKEGGGGGKGPKTPTTTRNPKVKTVDDILKLIAKLNEQEQATASQVQAWLKEIGVFFQTLKANEQLCAKLRDKTFQTEVKQEAFTKLLTVYCIKLKRRTDLENPERLVTLLKDNALQLYASFVQSLLNEENDADFDFDTSGEELSGIKNPKELEEYIRKLYDPDYDEVRLKNKLVDKLSPVFANINDWRNPAFEEVVNSFFVLLHKETTDDLDGLNEMVPDALNKFYFAKNNPVGLKNIFSTLILNIEAYLRKICYLKTGELFDENDGFVTVVKQIPALNALYYTDKEELQAFKSFYTTIYNWRNENAHKAPRLEDAHVEAAIHMVLCIYLYGTMVSVYKLKQVGEL